MDSGIRLQNWCFCKSLQHICFTSKMMSMVELNHIFMTRVQLLNPHDMSVVACKTGPMKSDMNNGRSRLFRRDPEIMLQH